MKTAYACFSTDVIHEGHLNIINEAKKYGKVVIGCLSDKASIRYNRFPTVPENERIELYKSIDGIDSVILQNDMLYDDVIKNYIQITLYMVIIGILALNLRLGIM